MVFEMKVLRKIYRKRWYRENQNKLWIGSINKT